MASTDTKAVLTAVITVGVTIVTSVIGFGIHQSNRIDALYNHVTTRVDTLNTEANARLDTWRAEAANDRRAERASMDEFRRQMQRLAERQSHVEGTPSPQRPERRQP